ncbi:MAG: esterase family protein [Verrucomicrobia bacterium]|nr:esterase family protein [Verrucomicrobiota bacterium]
MTTLFLLALSVSLAATVHAQPAKGKSPKKGGAARAEAQWVTPPVQGANLHHKTFESKAAGEKVSYLIYLPEAYEQKKDARFPVVYWLHGIGGSQQGVPRLCEQFTAAIAQGKMPGAIVVFVNGMVDSFYCDALKANRPVETVIIKELIPHIDTTYRTLATREARMIEGFSMGGYGAAHLGFKYPAMFGSVSIIDGALLDLGVMKTRHSEIFQRVFDGRDESFTAAHPLALAEKSAAQIMGRTLIRQAVGALVGPNIALHEKMTGLGIAHDYDLFEGVGHNLNAIYERLGDRNWAFYSKAFKAANLSK